MKALFSLVTLVFLAMPVYANEPYEVLISEFESLKKLVQTQDIEGSIGDLYVYSQMEGYIILRKPEFGSDHDVIRIFLNREFPEKDFVIQYILSDHLYADRKVLRRFIGPEPTGWVNDSVDVETQEYLGRQGNSSLRLKPEEQDILDELGITLL